MRPTKEWVTALNDADLPCGPVYSMDEVFADPQVRHLGIARPMHSTERGLVQVVGQAISLSRTPSDIVRPPPTIGQHTDEILADLGYSEAEIDGIKAAGAV